MSLVRALQLLPMGVLCAALAGQDPTPKPADKPAAQKTETPAAEPAKTTSAKAGGSYKHSTFGAYVQGVVPLHDLKEDLDRRSGYGLGAQWTHDHGNWHAGRTRIEWNTFPEGDSVAGTRTYAKNYTLSWDHLFKLNQGGNQAYLVAGIGGSRWYLEQTTAGLQDARWTTKLAITGGVGLQVAERLNLEARYVVSSVDRTFDANTLQVSLGWRFYQEARHRAR